MISTFHLLNWATPWGATLLLIPIGLAAWRWRCQQQLTHWADPHLLPWALASHGERHQTWRVLLNALAWGFLALAAAGPRLPLDDRLQSGTPRHAIDLMLVLDVSASMAATDIPPNRLARAKLELHDLISRLHGERVGVVIFAGQAGLLLPPTDDMALLNIALEQAGPELIEAQGSNLAAAIQLATRSLEANPLPKQRQRAILLVGDGETESLNSAGANAIRPILTTSRTPLFVLLTTSPTGANIPLPSGGLVARDGTTVISRPEEQAYADLAHASGGRLTWAVDGDDDWRVLYDQGIAHLPGETLLNARVQAWRPLFTAPLAAALVLFMLVYLPPALPMLWISLSFGLVPSPEAQAAELDPAHAAWQAYQSQRWGEAQFQYLRLGGYLGQMGAGATAWQLRDYASAQHHFATALLLADTPARRLDALYDLGHAHYGLGHWQTAMQAFAAVLQERPGDRRAQENLTQAEAQWHKLRGSKPMPSDLRGRRGSLAEGEVNLDWDQDSAIDEFAPTPRGPLVERNAAESAAHLQGNARATQRTRLDARLLQSGLTKLGHLEPQPRVLLQGLLKQDQVPSNGDPVPW